MNTKTYLSRLGWTVEKAFKRCADCRRYQAEYKRGGFAFSYRQINAALYLRHKRIAAVLSS